MIKQQPLFQQFHLTKKFTLSNIPPASTCHALTSRLHPDLVQQLIYRLLIDVALRQYVRLQQRNVALLKVADDGTGDVLTFVRAHRYFCCQIPLQFTRPQTPSEAKTQLDDRERMLGPYL